MIESKSSEVQAFWNAFCAREGIDPNTDYHARTFSDSQYSVVVGDELVKLARAGRKRGTAHLALDFEKNAIPQRKAGDYWVILDRSLAPRCVVRSTGGNIVPFNEVTEEFAASEGEADLSRAYWAKVHKSYFVNQLASWGKTFEEDMPIVCENFELVWAGPE